MQLFGDHPRSDHRPRLPEEDTFAFLDRADGIYFERVRSLLNAWFGQVSGEPRARLYARLRSGDEATSMGAFWELYLHEVLRRSGLLFEYEPIGSGPARTPDFRIDGPETHFFLEARLVGEPDERVASDQRRSVTIQAVRRIDSPNFWINMDIDVEGTSSPPLRRLRRDVQDWLASLDRDEIADLIASGRMRALPALTVRASDWVFRFRPIPKNLDALGKVSPLGSIGIFPGRTLWAGDGSRLRSALEEKARRYGDLGAPYVVALLSNDLFIDAETIRAVIDGGDDHPGFWRGGSNRRVSGILTAQLLFPWSVTTVTPIYWPNPEALRPLALALANAARADTPAMTATAIVPADEFFGLSQEWPGPEPPYSD